MNKALLTLILSGLLLEGLHAQEVTSLQRTENLKAFTKLYGYVRWFHPSDEAAAIDWERFAIYGCKEVENAKNSDELLAILDNLFKPIASTIRIYKTEDSLQFSMPDIKPPNPEKYKTTYWQHQGVELNQTYQDGTYRSVRVNRPGHNFKTISGSANVYVWFRQNDCTGQKFRIRALIRMGNETNGSGHLWVRDSNGHFLDSVRYKNPITSKLWQEHTIEGICEKGTGYWYYGLCLNGEGSMYVDDLIFEIYQDDKWKVLYRNGFESTNKSIPHKWISDPDDFVIERTNKDAARDRNCLLIRSRKKDPSKKLSKAIFDQGPSPGESFKEYLGYGITCSIPLGLYANRKHTFPEANPAEFKRLVQHIDSIGRMERNSHYSKLAAIVISWNVFQHFYPYWDVVKTDWGAALDKALNVCSHDMDPERFILLLEEMTAKVHDGHIMVYTKQEDYYPPFAWEWIEGKLIITKVLNDSVPLKIGSVVTEINGMDPKNFFDEKSKYISAATEGWMKERLSTETMIGKPKTVLTFQLMEPDGSLHLKSMERTLHFSGYYELFKNSVHAKKISDSTWYINLDRATPKEVDSLMPKLKKAKFIIADLRGYPNDNNKFVRHLLKNQKISISEFRTPQFIYPDREKCVFKEAHLSWILKALFLGPLKPHLDAKIIFITGNGAISWAETQIGLVQGYKLATFVGQPTAGTNGDVNMFLLPGGIYIQFTGLRVCKMDGSRLHGVGFLPDVYVNKTIRGVMEGRDEFLEKAIELAK